MPSGSLLLIPLPVLVVGGWRSSRGVRTQNIKRALKLGPLIPHRSEFYDAKWVTTRQTLREGVKM